MRRNPTPLVLALSLALLPTILFGRSQKQDVKAEFRTADRCVACHNGLKTSSGEDVSIGFQWRASIMANASRDPYWQGSIRRESIDHPESTDAIQNECSTCHMPMVSLSARAEGKNTDVFGHFPLNSKHPKTDQAEAADGVSCSVCHQIENVGLGTAETFNGHFKVATPSDKDQRPEYGPFLIDRGHQSIMQSSTGGFVPQEGAQIRDSALCASCHTLYTKALGRDGKEIGTLPEQMPYQEWLHSGYRTKETCQSCHMPEVKEPVAITALYGQPRLGLHRHEFAGANFFMQNVLNEHRDDLAVAATSDELTAASKNTAEFLKTQAARVSIRNMQSIGGRITAEVLVENLTGHKLPTAYPSRRAWLHVVVRDRDGRTVFESGALNANGSIEGNDNDLDASRFEPFYSEITSSDQVQIFEPILKDARGQVTTGLLSAVGYFKDDRILPAGFDKSTADKDVAVVGDALKDPGFAGGTALTRYSVDTHGAQGPFSIQAELWYQPIGYRWAHNLQSYKADEPQRFVQYYDAGASNSAVILAKTEARR